MNPTTPLVPLSRRYVLVTPVKNEEALIGETIRSVLGQTVRPVEWIIVNDGSKDATESIVIAAAAENAWIRLIDMPPRAGRNFGAVVRAAEAGLNALTVRDYAYVGLLDSDVRFSPDYFEHVLMVFEASPALGLAGGMVIDVGMSKDQLPRNRQDIPGAVQFYRRSCFEALGGLLAVPEGGWDGLACARARMVGFETRLLTHLVVDHLKPRNISEGGVLRRQWQMGIRDYAVGYHPVFEGVKCLSRVRQRPLLVGAIAWWVGYCCAFVQRRERRIPQDLLEFMRREQLRRLFRF
ncbi:MAG: glycosyltransferase family A protein [Cytophagales bacterium]|nr:glycosyltransferase family A protein [Cytophagales bacterium]